MSKMYRDNLQRSTVRDVVTFLLEFADKHDVILSKETLRLVCDRYCYIVDPPETPIEDDKYDGDDE